MTSSIIQAEAIESGTFSKPEIVESAKGKVTTGAGISVDVTIGKPNIVVAIPAYNEEVAIGSVVLRSKKYADKVIVINDGSHDKTAEIAKLAGAEVISHSNNVGKGVGIMHAFEYAKIANADILVLIDGDGQHNPDEIPTLIAPILTGEADMVNGSRFVNGNGHNVPKYRRVGQEVLTFATNRGSNLNITDTQNGYRAFSKKTFNSFSFHENGMAIESEMLMDAAQADLRIKEVPIDVRYDVKGSTLNPVRHGFGVLGKIISLVSIRRPLIFFCVPGVVLLAFGVIFVVLSFNSFNLTRNISVIYTAGSAICVLIGIFSIFTGFILNAIQSMRKK